MLEDSAIIPVTNKIMSTVVYTIPERNNLVRRFRSKETKKVEMGELRQLSYNPGGLRVLRDYLTIGNKEAVAELLGEVEPEYYYTVEDIKTLLATGTIAQFEDFLNFAPEGAIEQMKDLAVSTKLNDNSKRELIKKKLEFDVTNAIKLLEEDVEKVAPENKVERKAAPIKDETESVRKSEPISKYNVVN